MSIKQHELIKINKCLQQNKKLFYFQIQQHVQYGQAIYLIGSIPQIGLWNINNSIKLNWNTFDIWSVQVEIQLNENLTPQQIIFQYKYFINYYDYINSQFIIWQNLTSNRKIHQQELKIYQFSLQNNQKNNNQASKIYILSKINSVSQINSPKSKYVLYDKWNKQRMNIQISLSQLCIHQNNKVFNFQIPIKFSLSKNIHFGYAIYIIGIIEELGKSQKNKIIRLNFNEQNNQWQYQIFIQNKNTLCYNPKQIINIKKLEYFVDLYEKQFDYQNLSFLNYDYLINLQFLNKQTQLLIKSIQKKQKQYEKYLELQKLKIFKQKQQKFKKQYKAKQFQQKKIKYNDKEIKMQIKLQKDKINFKPVIKQLKKTNFINNHTKTNNTLEEQKIIDIQQLLTHQNCLNQLDKIYQQDKQQIYMPIILNQILSQQLSIKQKQQTIKIEKKFIQKAIEKQDSTENIILCLSQSIKSMFGDQVQISFSQKSTIKSKVSTKILTTGYGINQFTYSQKIQDGETEWNFDMISNNSQKLQQFQQWYKNYAQKQYQINPESMRIKCIIKGSIKIEFQSNPAHQNSRANSRLKLHPYFKNYQLSPEDFDPIGNIQFPNQSSSIQFRGNWPYYTPIKCKRYGIKVLGCFDEGSNQWLQMNNKPSQWAVAFHGVQDPNGTNRYCKNGQKVLNSMMDGKKKGQIIVPGYRNKHASDISLNHNVKIGDGIYCTPHLHTALVYSKIVNINNKGYAIIFQCRVNQKKTHISKRQDYWIVNNSHDIRPYGIILVKQDVKRNYPSPMMQFKEQFTYNKYKSRIDMVSK